MQRIAVAVVLSLCVAARASAQAPVDKSFSEKFFIGGGLEGTAIATNISGSATVTESGAGGGLVVGYGFTRQWALYGNFSAASISAAGGNGSYGLGHFDVGARVHFRTGPNVVVPFVQFGLSGRAVSENITDRSGTHTVTASGAGVAAGAGLNAYFNPSFAFSGSVTWAFGNFSNYSLDNVSIAGSTVSATSTRVHLGIVWFPQAHSK